MRPKSPKICLACSAGGHLTRSTYSLLTFSRQGVDIDCKLHPGIVLGDGKTTACNHYHRSGCYSTDGILCKKTAEDEDYIHQFGR